MSESLQFEHPDADQLNAFVEHTLPAAAREHTLAHLAVCAECRLVVALAASVEEDFPAPVVTLPAARPLWRVPVWQWGLPFAGVVALVAVMVHRPGAPKVTPGPEERASIQAALPPPAQNAATQAPMPAKPPVASSLAGAAGPEDLKRRIESLPAMGRDVQSMAPPPLPVPHVASPKLPEALSAGAGVASSLPQRPVMMGAAAPAIATAAAPAPPPPLQVPLAQPMAPRVRAATAEQSASATVLTGASLNALSDDPDVARGGSRMIAAAPAVVTLHPLPSGQPAVSTAAGAGAVLALDGGNHLYVTRDGGAHWVAVPTQWGGRAMRVATAASSVADQPSDQATFAAPADAAPADAPARPVVATAAPSASAAATSSVTGLVTDPTGALIAGAAVSLRDPATQAVVRTATTDKNGRFNIPAAPGSYLLRAEKPGFTTDSDPITVAAGTKLNENLALAVGSESTVIEVQASNADLQTLNATVGEVLSSEKPSGELKIAAKKMKVDVVTPLFELVTDKGERFVSADGVTWMRR